MKTRPAPLEALETSVRTLGASLPENVLAALRGAAERGAPVTLRREPIGWRGDVERVVATVRASRVGRSTGPLEAAGFTPPASRGTPWVWVGPSQPGPANDGPVHVSVTESGRVMLTVQGASHPVEIVFGHRMADYVGRQLQNAAEGINAPAAPLHATG